MAPWGPLPENSCSAVGSLSHSLPFVSEISTKLEIAVRSSPLGFHPRASILRIWFASDGLNGASSAPSPIHWVLSPASPNSPGMSILRSNSCSIFINSTYFRQRLSFATMCKSPPSLGHKSSEGCSLSVSHSKQKGGFPAFKMTTSLSSIGRQLCVGLSSKRRSLSLKVFVPTHEKASKFHWNTRFASWTLGGASVGMCLSFSTSGPVFADSPRGVSNGNIEDDKSSLASSHGKKVFTDYSITGIPGDGRCLFRSVAHGACIRSGKPLPNESLQRELADELRAQVADEFVKRRAETEWFIEGDFDTYVSQIRKPHVWGGEPELLMASHVLQMPITVYMHDEDSGGLIAIAEYGQEYGKENPIQVLYHGYGHYDSLQIPSKKGIWPRL